MLLLVHRYQKVDAPTRTGVASHHLVSTTWSSYTRGTTSPCQYQGSDAGGAPEQSVGLGLLPCLAAARTL
eukprot:1216620-Rhodomonas_salina.1